MAPPTLIGDSAPMREIREEIERVDRTDAKILITGESGSGKEIVAALIYAKSPRASRPFIAVNCAGLPETLLESEPRCFWIRFKIVLICIPSLLSKLDGFKVHP